MSLGYSTTAALSQNAGATTLTPVVPNITSRIGGVFLAIINIKSNSTISTATSGWTKVSQSNGTGFTQAIFIAPMSSLAPVLTWTGSVAAAAYVVYLEGSKGNLQTTAIGAAATATSGSSPHTNGGATSTRTWSIALLVDSVATNTGSYTTTPSGWSNIISVGASTANLSQTLSYLNFGIGTSSTGAISTSGTVAAATWITDIVEIQYESIIADDGNPTSVGIAENEVGLWLSPGTGVAVGELEPSIWLSPGNGVAVGELEPSIWLSPGDGIAVAELESVIWTMPPAVNVAELESVIWTMPSAVNVAEVEVVIWIQWPNNISTTPPAAAPRRRYLLIN